MKFILLFLFSFNLFAAEKIGLNENSCTTKTKVLADFLKPAGKISDEQTVFSNGMSPDGLVWISKPDGENWNSFRDLNVGFTRQGDPRNPIFFFGEKLARELDFNIQDGRFENFITLFVPGAPRLETHIRRANIILKKRNQDPIPYLPISMGYATAEQIIHLSLQGDGDIIFSFPYADIDNRLVPHEVSYHLGALIYPRFIFKRANQITRHTINIINLLRSHAKEFGVIGSVIIREITDQLYQERSYEIDAGTADIQAILSYHRSFNLNQSYASIWQEVSTISADMDSLQSKVDFISRPSLTPLEAVMKRIYLMTDVTPVNLGSPYFSMLTEDKYGYGRKIKLTRQESERLRVLLKKYFEDHKMDDGLVEISTAEVWLKRIVLGLDQRIEEISSALKEANSR